MAGPAVAAVRVRRPPCRLLPIVSLSGRVPKGDDVAGREVVGRVESFDPSRWPRFVHFPAFTRDWARLGLDDAALRALEVLVLGAPEGSPVVRGTGGLRKIRFAPPGSGRGKSGSYRIDYAYYPEFGSIALMIAFGKGERSDLSAADREAIAVALRALHGELEREFSGRPKPEGRR